MAKQPELNKPEAENINQPVLADEVKKTSDTELLFSKLLALLEEKGKTQPASAPIPTILANTIAGQDGIDDRLTKEVPVAVAFPGCADVLLGLVDPDSSKYPYEKSVSSVSIDHLFFEYFSFGSHVAIPTNANQNRDRLQKLYDNNPCLQKEWPPRHCLPAPCIKLDGNRRSFVDSPNTRKLQRIFIGDLAWLFYMERMGIFQMLGRILDEYAYSGGIPMSNGSVHADVKDDMIALVLEAMTRQTEAGTSSKVRDRDTSYRRSLGWTSEAGRNLGQNSSAVNSAFNTQFHKFIHLALQFFKDKRLAVAIRATTDNTGVTSAATLVTIRDTISLLFKSFDNFKYGRNYHNALSGIVWAVAGFKLVEELRPTIGIPPEYASPAEFIPAAFDILVTKRPITSGESNRFETHMECARNIRDILLDIEKLRFSQAGTGGELENWLNAAEGSIEGYRTAYRTLTGVDLESSSTPVIEQQV